MKKVNTCRGVEGGGSECATEAQGWTRPAERVEGSEWKGARWCSAVMLHSVRPSTVGGRNSLARSCVCRSVK